MHWLLRFVARLQWLRLGLRLRLLCRFANSERAPHHQLDLPFFGLRYSGWLDNYIDWCVYFFGAYEREELLFLRARLQKRPRRVCLDVGANTGHHSLFFSTLFAQVHAFEPFPPVIEMLRTRIRENQLTDRVTVHPCGLSAKEGELFFHEPEAGNTGTGWFGPDRDASVAKITPLRVRRGDDIVAELGIDQIDFIKFDVEGHEVSAIEGLRETVAKHRPVIWIEWNHPGESAMRDRLLACVPAGYEVFTLRTNEPWLGVFNHPDGRLCPADFSERCNLWLEPKGSAAA